MRPPKYKEDPAFLRGLPIGSRPGWPGFRKPVSAGFSGNLSDAILQNATVFRKLLSQGRGQNSTRLRAPRPACSSARASGTSSKPMVLLTREERSRGGVAGGGGGRAAARAGGARRGAGRGRAPGRAGARGGGWGASGEPGPGGGGRGGGGWGGAGWGWTPWIGTGARAGLAR